MVVTNLRETLARLHAELGSASELDAESQRLLKDVAADIERLVHKPDAQAAGAGLAPASLTQASLTHGPRLEQLAVRFEADHPALAGSVREILDILGRAGL